MVNLAYIQSQINDLENQISQHNDNVSQITATNEKLNGALNEVQAFNHEFAEILNCYDIAALSKGCDISLVSTHEFAGIVHSLTKELKAQQCKSNYLDLIADINRMIRRNNDYITDYKLRISQAYERISELRRQAAG